MITRTVSQIADMCGAILKTDQKDLLIRGVSRDSRHMDGELFIPIIGERFDGHQYIHDAVANGAKATLWKKGVPVPEDLSHIPFLMVRDPLAALQKLAMSYRAELFTRIVAITGSNGKTTTKDMTAALLSTMYKVSKTSGNLNNHIGLPLTILSLEEDTDIVVLEMGMSGFGEIELLTKIASPDVAIITNIGDAHMQQLGSRQGIAKAKLEIVQGLGDDGVLIYNGDEPLLEEEMAKMNIPETIERKTFGLNVGNQWSAVDIKLTPFSSSFEVMYLGKSCSVGKQQIPISGRHNVGNALSAIATARLFGVPAEEIAKGFAQLEVSAMRVHPTKAANGATILNDAYNANPTAMMAAIDIMQELEGFKRKWLVIGDMLELGDNEKSMHADVGKYAAKADFQYILGFGELSAYTIEAANTYGNKVLTALHFMDKNSLIDWLQEHLQEEDLVLVKGSRGMRMEQVVEALEKG